VNRRAQTPRKKKKILPRGGLVAGPVSAKEARGLRSSRGSTLSATVARDLQNSARAAVGTKQHVACRTVAGPLSAQTARALQNSRGPLSAQSSTWPAEQSRGRCRQKKQHVPCKTVAGSLSAQAARGLKDCRAAGAVVPVVPVVPEEEDKALNLAQG
jgi:hypothetical protein